ncbi:hypothetical protein COCNU_scaffold000436G000010 [Cocos nucifera]|nr:hypothetical protein [Cocos nucifera]
MKRSAIAKVRRKASFRGSNSSDGDPEENPFNNRGIIKQLIDGCILLEVVDRIVEADPEQHIWDSLGSFLEMGHQLIANIKAMNNLRSEVIKAQEDHQVEINHLLEGKAKFEVYWFLHFSLIPDIDVILK